MGGGGVGKHSSQIQGEVNMGSWRVTATYTEDLEIPRNNSREASHAETPSEKVWEYASVLLKCSAYFLLLLKVVCILWTVC